MPILTPLATLSPSYNPSVPTPPTTVYPAGKTLPDALADGGVIATNDVRLEDVGPYWTQHGPASADRIEYDPVNDNYTYYTDSSNGSGSHSTAFLFPSSTAVSPAAGTPYSSSNYSAYAAKDAASGDVTSLILFKPGVGNTQIALTYASFGALVFAPTQNSPTAGGPYSSPSTRFFVYGFPTPFTTLQALTGTATFSGISNGGYQDASGIYLTQGTSSLTANFSAGTVAASISFTGVNVDPSGPPLGMTTFGGGGNGIIAGVQFSGDLHGPSSGSFFGNFYGPNAEEFGFVYYLKKVSSSDQDVTGIGAAVGKRP